MSEKITSITKLDNKLNCDIYKTSKTNIANIKIPKIENSLPYFIFIVDQSSSMDDYFKKIITSHIPDCLKSLNYPPEKICNLITFCSRVFSSNLNTNDFINSNLNSWGCTYMNEIFDELEKTFEKLKPEKELMIRILAISDGEIHDRNRTKVKADKLFRKYKGQFKINAQAIRLKTSENANPDTEALSSILQFSDFDSKLIEIKEEEISSLGKIMTDLFKNDNLCGGELLLVSDKNNLKIYPWQENAQSKVQLNPDLNTIFIEKEEQNEEPNLEIQRNDEKCKLNLKIHPNLKYKFENIVAPETLSVIEQKIKINKIINTPQTQEENKKIIKVISEFNDDSENDEKAKNDEDNYINSLEKLEKTEQEKITKLNNDKKAIYINTKRNLKKVDDLIVNKNTLEDMLKEKESKMIMLAEIQNTLNKFENSQNMKNFSDFSNPNIEEDIKNENKEKTEMIENVMNSLTKINMDLNANFSEIADEKSKENIEKAKKEFSEKISNIVSNLNKIEFDLTADFSQVKNKNIVEMIENQRKERQKMMREKIENLKKINVDLTIDFSDFKNENILEDIKKEKDEQLKIVNDAKDNLKQGDGINNGSTAFSDFENRNITEYIQKQNEVKTERLEKARTSLKTSDIKNWREKGMSEFENKNIRQDIKNGEEKKIEILNTARASLKTSKLKLNQNTIEQIKKKKEMEEQQLIELRKSLKKGRRYTFPLVPNYPDIISSIPKEEETKNNFEFKKTDSDDSNSTNTGKEDPKENPSKEALNPVVLNQSESSSRRSSNASQEAMFANIKKNLKKINRKNTIA